MKKIFGIVVMSCFLIFFMMAASLRISFMTGWGRPPMDPLPATIIVGLSLGLAILASRQKYFSKLIVLSLLLAGFGFFDIYLGLSSLTHHG